MTYLNTVVPKIQEYEHPKFLTEGGSIASKAYNYAVNSYINSVDPEHKRSRLLYDGEYHIPLHNFSGPGTRIDLTDVRNMKPYNSIDACSKTHDIEYSDIKNSSLSKEDKAKAIIESDKKAIECYDKTPNEYGYSLAKSGIKGKVGVENLLSLIKGKPTVLYGGAEVINLQPKANTFSILTARKDVPNIASKGIKEALQKISKNYDNITPFGSWTYRSQLYPGDIDLIEYEEFSDTKENAIKKAVKMTKDVVEKINNSEDYYLGDIKAGLDKRFIFNIGNLDYQTKQLTNFNPEKIQNILEELVNSGALSDEEMDIMRSHIQKAQMFYMENDQEEGSKHYEEFYDEIREKWLLRWTYKEIIQGFKELKSKPKNIKKYLHEAIQEPTMTKIDMWTNIDSRFLEISNVLVYNWKRPDGTIEVLNFQNDINNLSEQLKYEVEKYAFSSKYFKPTKMLKRMWSISRSKGFEDDIKILTPILQSDIGRLSQIVSDIDVLTLIIKKGNGIKSNEIPYKEISDELTGIRYRLANVYDIITKEIEIEVNEAIDYIINILKTNNRERIYCGLKEIKKYLNDLLQEYTIGVLKRKKYFPPPDRFLP